MRCFTLRYAEAAGFRFLAAGIAMLALASCQTAPPTPVVQQAESAETGDWQKTTATRFSVDPARSEIRFLVYREGSLAELGHNHVIVGTLTGDIFLGDTAADSGFRLCIPVELFEVDDDAVRAEEGNQFLSPIPEAARAATRENMLSDKVLNASAHPAIEIQSRSLSGPIWNPDVTARVTIAGNRMELEFPAAVVAGDQELTVIARTSISQAAFSLEPFSVLGGNLRVRDIVDIRTRIVARISEGSGTSGSCVP